jgi:hypothetical protein
MSKTLSKPLFNSHMGSYGLNNDKIKFKFKFMTKPYQLYDMFNNNQSDVQNV